MSANSCKPHQAGGEENEAEKVSGRLVVASGDPTKLLEPVEEELDEVPLLVEVCIEMAPNFALLAGRDDCLHSLGSDCRDDCVGIVALVGDEVVASRGFDERGRFDDIVDVSRREVEVGWITETVHESVDLGCSASARASNTLTLGPPFPPAACWWALTQVESAILDSLSASTAKALSTCSNTP